MSKSILLIFDLDDTLVYSDGRIADFSVLFEFVDAGYTLAIASRNDAYYVTEKLESLGILHLFKYVIADFRPKIYQIRQIVYESQKSNVNYNQIVFIDDYLPHIERIRLEEPHVVTLHFGVDVKTLTEVKQRISSF